MKIAAKWYGPDHTIDLTGCSEIVFGEVPNQISVWVRDGQVEVGAMRHLATLHDMANQFMIVFADR